MSAPEPTVCPKCGSRAAEWICHLCKTVKVEPEARQPAPAEGYYDIWEEIKRANAMLYPPKQ